MSVQQVDEEYRSRISSLRSLLQEDDKKHAQVFERDINAIIAAKKSYTNELRMERNRDIRSQYEIKLAQHDLSISQLLSTAPILMNSSDQAKVLLELIERSNLYHKGEGKSNDDLISAAKELQDKTLDSIAQSKMMIYSSTETGVNTLQTLEHQRSQLQGIDDTIEQVDGSLNRASVLVVEYTKRVSEDNYCKIVTVFNISLVILIIIYIFLSSNSNN